MDRYAALWAVVGGGTALALRALGHAIIADVAARISATVWGIRTFDKLTTWLLRHPVWSGTWEVTWTVRSKNFLPSNTETGQLHRCFNSVAFEAAGTTTNGQKILYAFIGKLSRSKTILTGTWFDRRGTGVGYHGVFQLRLQGGGNDQALGMWTGFSEQEPKVNSDAMTWIRLGD